MPDRDPPSEAARAERARKRAEADTHYEQMLAEAARRGVLAPLLTRKGCDSATATEFEATFAREPR